MGYEQIKSDFKRYKQFFSEDDEKVLHIIETGFVNEERRYIVVHEDAYGSELGKSELMSEKDIWLKYRIKLNTFKSIINEK